MSVWQRFLLAARRDPNIAHALSFQRKERETYKVFPPENEIFKAFRLTPFDKVKVIILGQDPYHKEGQAHGLSFGVPTGVDVPPSLGNIYKEIERAPGCPMPDRGSLEGWAKQGVFLLNSILTVRQGAPGIHADIGWEKLTDATIKLLSAHRTNLVFMLWGSFAKKKSLLIDETKHLILESAHPSPLSAHRGFIGNNHFQLCNDYLADHGKEPIIWSDVD